MTHLFRLSLALLTACGSTPGTAAPESTKSVSAASAEATDSAVVATVNGQPVTQADLMEFAAPEIIAAEAAAYEARSSALDALITQRLIEKMADSEGMSPEDLVKREVESKIAPPTDAAIEAFYQENQARMRGATLEQARPSIVQYLSREQGTEQMRVFIQRLMEEAEVERHLEPYRVEVPTGDSPRWGSEDAPVQIVEFSDFQCPYCSQGAATVEKIKETYGDKVSIVYRHFPLPMHEQAPRAAEASECAHEQGKFWEYHDALFAELKSWTDEDLVALAKDVGLKKKKFEQCLESGKHEATVKTDIEEGRAVGMQGTPGYYVNGIVVSGAQPFEAFASIIDRELEGR